FRASSRGSFQLNLWIPDAAPSRDAETEARMRDFLASWGPAVPATAGETRLPDFGAQCEAFLEIAPTAVSSIMGLFPTEFVARLKARGIRWLATATTLTEAQ